MTESDAGRAARRRAVTNMWNKLKIFAPALVVTVAGFVVAYQFVEPAPPRVVTIATGSEEGAYYAFARRYARHLAEEGIELVVRSTAGSVENLSLLTDRRSGVDLAFMQGGVGTPEEAPDLTSLGSLYLEPFWVFVRGDLQPTRLGALRGRRIAVGVEGSGTRAVALRLLADNGIDAENTRLLALGGSEAAAALRAGTVDAAMFVISPTSETVRGLLAEDDIRLLSFDRAEAYARLYRFLSPVILPEGAVDLARNLPPADVRLLAPAATLVADPGLHPALASLLLQVAREVHRDGGLLEAPDEFPSPRLATFPLSEEARRFYDEGPPFLQRYLPFWAANLADRLKIMLLPLLTLLYPVFKLLPPTYQWRMRARVLRWYRELLALEDRLRAGALTATQARGELRRIEDDVARISVPLAYTDRVYQLRAHIDLLRRELAETEPEAGVAAGPPGEQASGQ